MESFERINSIRETNENFDSCNSCKRLGTSRLHELHESKFPFVSRIEFIRSKLSNLSAHVYGVIVDCHNSVPPTSRRRRPPLWETYPRAIWCSGAKSAADSESRQGHAELSRNSAHYVDLIGAASESLPLSSSWRFMGSGAPVAEMEASLGRRYHQ